MLSDKPPLPYRVVPLVLILKKSSGDRNTFALLTVELSGVVGAVGVLAYYQIEYSE